MEDPVGPVMNVAGLFRVCTESLELVQLGRASAKDDELLETKFGAQKLRFLIWGQVVGVYDVAGYDKRLDLPSIRPMVMKILYNVRLLFDDEEKLARLYGLGYDGGNLRPLGKILFEESYNRFQSRIRRTQKQANLGTTAKWKISNKRQFAYLVEDLKDLVDSLDDITRSLQLLPLQEDLLIEEVESISNPESLRLLEQVFEGHERLSDTASRRLQTLENQSMNSRGRVAVTDTSSSSLVSFHTAPSHQSDTGDHQL
jgi:Prion-inhibition and propagation